MCDWVKIDVVSLIRFYIYFIYFFNKDLMNSQMHQYTDYGVTYHFTDCLKSVTNKKGLSENCLQINLMCLYSFISNSP